MGYLNFSMSERAAAAYHAGLRPASKCARGVPAALVRKWCEPHEWHHTSKLYNPTDFFCPIDVRTTFGLLPAVESCPQCGCEHEPHEEAVAALAAHRAGPSEERWAELDITWSTWDGHGRYARRRRHHYRGPATVRGDWLVLPDGRRLSLVRRHIEITWLARSSRQDKAQPAR